MGEFDRRGIDRVNAFRIDQTTFFKQYFEGNAVFNRLKQYYNNSQYRFEVPLEDFENVKSFLDEHGYILIMNNSPEEYSVVVEKYTNHPENIFKSSVLQRTIENYNCFLLKDKVSVEQAVNNGATALKDTPLPNPY